MRVSGLRRIAMRLAPERLGITKIDSYSDADMALLKTMILRNYGNLDLIDEANRILDNLTTVQNMVIPSNIPTAFVLADRSVEINRKVQGLDWIKLHEDQVAGNVYGKVILLAGEHYIFYNHIDDIKMIVDELLETE
jgi:hypothetical protein